MKTWHLPAKTFLVGEYAALTEQPAIVLTTTPCFALTLTQTNGLVGVHQESPAGLWWAQQATDLGLHFHDPYFGAGGLGASSAQFLGSFIASRFLKQARATREDLLTAYYQVAWSGQGLRPSGYDVLAQAHHGCVFIHKEKNVIKSYSWRFDGLAFLLIHTGHKLATHEHLQHTTLPQQVHALSAIVHQAQHAFATNSNTCLIEAVNHYHQQLVAYNKVAPHTLACIEKLRAHPEVQAIKGCGALGADVILLMCATSDKAVLQQKLSREQWQLLASESELYAEGDWDQAM